MIRQKIIAKVHILKNKNIHLNKSKTPRIVTIHSINTITNGINSIFRVEEEIGVGNKSSKNEFNMRDLFSIHKKMVSEGKATFVFKMKIGMKHQNSTYCSNMMLKDLEEDFDVFTVFLYDCQIDNLKIFVDNVIEFIKNKNDTDKNKEISKEQGKDKQIEKSANFRRPGINNKNARLLEGQNVRQIKKRNVRDIMKSFDENSEKKDTLIEKPVYISNTQKSLSSEQFINYKTFVLVFFVSEFLEKSENRVLIKVSKNIQRMSDLKRKELIIAQKYPPLEIFTNLITRYKNLEILKFNKNVKFRFSNDFFGKIKLNNLRKLDISKCFSTNEIIINKFLNICPNLENIKLPYNVIRYSNMANLKKNLLNTLDVLKFKYNPNLALESEIGQYLNFFVNFFKNNRKIKKFNFLA